MEILPKPFGIVRDVEGGDADVLVSGIVSFDDALAGVKYYTTTLGTILSGNMYFGEECTASEAITYVDLQEEQNVILSADSVVGAGISKKSLILSPKF